MATWQLFICILALLVLTGVGCIVALAAERYFKSKTEINHRELFVYWITDYIKSSEQLSKFADGVVAEDKFKVFKEYAAKSPSLKRLQKEIQISDNDMKAIVDGVVYDMNQIKKIPEV